jgi:dephospho-CoA kinase
MRRTCAGSIPRSEGHGTLKIGLTGGIGSGKSTVARLFAARGVPVIDADQIARELVCPGMPAFDAIVDALGNDVVRGGELDRAAVRERIFRDAGERTAVEAILHPLVYRRMAEQVHCVRAPYCILSIPLLLETGGRSFVDRVLVVDCSVERQLERVQARDRSSACAVRRILATQVAREERLQAADDVIDNDGEPDRLPIQVSRLHERYSNLASQPS